MANSYVRIIIHCVWSTKRRQMTIAQDWEKELWSYIGGVVRKHHIHPIQIGGIENHVHALVEPPKSMDVCQLLQTLKGPTSKWVNVSGKLSGKFNWQDGYGAFSVSPSMIPRVVRYIENQRKHHVNKTFEEEYRELLRWHKIDFEEAYLLD